MEAVSYSSLTKKVVQKFLNKERIITDNANAQNWKSAGRERDQAEPLGE